MKPGLKKLALSLWLALTGAANAADFAWVQATTQGYEARLMTAAPRCPMLVADGKPSAMAIRAPASDNFALVCAAPLPAGVHAARYDWLLECRAGDCDPQRQFVAGNFPVPVADPQRILVLGDTGCRLKGAILQDCNTPARWPFPQVAAAAAAMKPDLVIHLGDYLYRETPCPPGDAGCAGSPFGDNGPAWAADFFTPAAPLLAAAPIVLARGNHEECDRAGPGWLRLLGPQAFDPAAPCIPHLPVFTLDLGGERLAVLDDASASDTEVTPDMPVYAAEFKGLAAIPGPVWLLHHRPVWAAISGPLGIPVGGNKTMIAAAGDAPIPAPPVTLMLSGHIHTFESLNYDQGVPPQIVGGNGGDNLDVTPRNLKGTIFQGHSGVSVTDGLSVGGFGFLMMTRTGGDWVIDLYDEAGRPKGQCRFVPPAAGNAVGRVNCKA